MKTAKLISASLVLTCILFLLCSCAGEKNSKPDVSGLENKEGIIFDFEKNNYYENYVNRQGITEKKITYENGKAVMLTVYEYGTDGKCNKEYIYNAETGFKDCQTVGDYYYENSDNPAKIVFCTPEGDTVSIEKYDYDEQGNISSKDIIGTDGLRSSYFVYERDNTGKIEKASEYDGKGELAQLVRYKYNGDCDCVSKTYSDAGDNDIKTDTYTYSEPGKPSAMISVTVEGETEKELTFVYS